MKNIKILKDKLDLLPINEGNIKLYEDLLSLEFGIYKNIIIEVIEGRLDIENTRQLISKYIPQSITNIENIPLLMELENTNDVIKENIINKIIVNNGTIINDGLIYKNDTDLKFRMGSSYEIENGVTLSDTDKEKIFTTKGGLQVITTQIDRISIDDTLTKKEQQLQNYALLSPNVEQFL